MNTGTNYAELFYSNTVNDIDTLEKNVRDYPVSSIARFLLLYHHKKNNHPGFEELAKQTGIYLNNPYWIQYQISQVELAVEEKISDKKEENISSTISEPIIHDVISENDSINEENVEEHSIETKEVQENVPATFSESTIQNPVTENNFIDEENIEEHPIEIKEEQVISESVPIDTPVSGNDSVDEENKEEHVTETKEEENISMVFSKSNHSPDSENNSAHEELIAFEPLHTVDYFASQGIKITEEALENDHLGKQVKSFTAWLKSMKRLHPGQIPEQNEVIERIIQSSSEVSNQNADVLTEAMAEVLIKQDKKGKAIEMYQKLSLINPSKSAYFAAKIESLKTN